MQWMTRMRRATSCTTETAQRWSMWSLSWRRCCTLLTKHCTRSRRGRRRRPSWQPQQRSRADTNIASLVAKRNVRLSAMLARSHAERNAWPAPHLRGADAAARVRTVHSDGRRSAIVPLSPLPNPPATTFERRASTSLTDSQSLCSLHTLGSDATTRRSRACCLFRVSSKHSRGQVLLTNEAQQGRDGRVSRLRLYWRGSSVRQHVGGPSCNAAAAAAHASAVLCATATAILPPCGRG